MQSAFSSITFWQSETGIQLFGWVCYQNETTPSTMLITLLVLYCSSRLGCQIVLTKELDGLEVTVPEGLADARS